MGGALGGLLLLVTPASFFARMVPWLVLFATAVFAYGSFGRRRSDGTSLNLGAGQAAAAQFAIAIYGGYFGGGIGFLMLPPSPWRDCRPVTPARPRTCWPAS